MAKQYAAIWEDEIKGYVALDENRTFAELAKWYFETVAPSVLNFTAKVVANRLGHVNTRTTLEVYSHVFAETEEKAMQAIDMALFRKAE